MSVSGKSSDPSAGIGRAGVIGAASVLCVVWALPDVLASPVSFVATRLGEVDLWGLVSVLCWPGAGVAAFLAGLMRGSERLRGAVILLAAVIGAALYSFSGWTALPVSGPVFFAAFIGAVGAGALVARFKSRTLGTLAAMLLPLSILGVHLAAMISGAYPLALFTPVKAAANSGAAVWLGIEGAGVLLRRSGR